MKPNKILVIDLEATCWKETQNHTEKSEIIEIGIVDVDIRDFEINNKKSIYVKNEKAEISDFCSSLTGITQKIIDDKGVIFSDACEILKQEYDSENRIWLSYGDYDRNMFLKQCRLKSVKYPLSNKHINLKMLISVLEGFGKEMGMAKVLSHFNLNLFGKHHCGADDAYNTARLLTYILKRYRNIKIFN